MDDRTKSVADATARETQTDDTPDAKTREIRDEISQTREDLAETIDAIQDKLRPSNLVSEATGRVKEATTERVKQMAHSASDTAGEFMEAGRQNWIPAALIGVGTA